MPKEQFVTKKYLDKRLDEHSRIIVSAVDEILTKRLKETNERMGLMETRLNRKIDAAETKLEKKIDNVQILIDAYVKEQENFKQEFVIMKEEMRQIKSAIKKKLGIQIRAI